MSEKIKLKFKQEQKQAPLVSVHPHWKRGHKTHFSVVIWILFTLNRGKRVLAYPFKFLLMFALNGGVRMRSPNGR